MDKLVELKNVLSEENYGLEYESYDSNGSLRFTAPKYHQGFFQNLKYLQENEKFSDIILRTSLEPSFSIKAHKLILSASSHYFKAMLTGGFKENQCQEIFIENVSTNTLQAIIDFIYTSQVVVKEANVQNLLVTAKMLQIEDIVNACCIFLELNMEPTNCIGIEEFAKTYGCMILAEKTRSYMSKHFCEVIGSEEFLNLNALQLCKLLSRDELIVSCESIIFLAVLDWVKYDPEKRRNHLDHLFQCVRFGCMPPQFLREQMTQNDIFKLKETDKSKQFLQRVCDDLISHKPCSLSYNPRTPAFPFALYVVGGYHRQSINTVECFKYQTMTWERGADMHIPRSGLCCVSLALYIYAIGGRNNSTHGNFDCADVECYDPFVNIWRKRQSMTVPRSRAGCGVIDGLIYVFGGAFNTAFHSSVERYLPKEDRWELVRPMKTARIGLGSAVVNRLLYAIGGFDGNTRLNEVEVYNPDQNIWTLAAPMITPRSGAGATAMDNNIYVVGGYTTNMQLNTAEKYDVITNQWTLIASMSSPRSAIACVTWKGRICALGGYNGNDFLSSNEVYDPENDRWETKCQMSTERSGHGAAVTIDFPQR